MLQLFHKYNRTFGGLMVLCALAVTMTGFGLDAFTRSPSQQPYAIRVDDYRVGFPQFEQARRRALEGYRRQLGPEAYELIERFGIRVGEQVSEQLINDHLETRAATNLGLRVGDEELRDFLRSQIPPGMTAAEYEGVVRREFGTTPAEYEADVQQVLLRQQYQDILEVASRASRREIEAELRSQRTAYKVKYTTFDPAEYLKAVSEPTDAELQAAYDKDSTGFQIPQRVRFGYLVVTSEMALSEVPVSEDDVEIAYTDRLREFTEAEQAEVNSILIAFPDAATEEQKTQAREKAALVKTKLLAGEPETAIALQFSDDLATKTTGGDLGVVTRGKLPTAVLDAVFALKGPGVTEPVEAPKGMYVIKARSYKPERLKSMEEVRPLLEKSIRETEAPAFAAEKAQLLYEKWQNSKQSLKEFAAEAKLTYAESGTLRAASEDPDALATGIVKSVLRTPDESKQFAELGKNFALVEVQEFRDTEKSPLADVRTKLVERLKQEKSVVLAREDAKAFIASALEKKGVAAAAVGSKRLVEERDGVTRQTPGAAPFDAPEVQEAVFATVPGSITSREVKAGEKYFVFEVLSATPPSAEEIAKELSAQSAQASATLARLLQSATTRKLRKETTVIDVDSSVMGAE